MADEKDFAKELNAELTGNFTRISGSETATPA
jgi:hypothetical protein